MSFFKNKHVIASLVIAPLLAIGAYYLVDLLVREQPKPAQAGQAYPLIASPNCRYESGVCELSNAEFQSTLTVDWKIERPVLTLKSNYALQGVKAAFVTLDGTSTEPMQMVLDTADRKTWKVVMGDSVKEDTVVRLALTANNSHYFAETTLVFSNYQTAFNKDFRQ